ncbi:hypothetical protein LINPERHAP1_LOCUS5343 [Linum perenne]
MIFWNDYALANKLLNTLHFRKDGTISGSHTLFLSSTVEIMQVPNHQDRRWTASSLPPGESCPIPDLTATSNPSGLFRSKYIYADMQLFCFFLWLSACSENCYIVLLSPLL